MPLKKLLLLLLVAIIITGCPIKNERPIKEVAPYSVPELPLSSIEVPVEILSSDLSNRISKELPNPILTGQTQELSVQLLAQEKKEEDKNLWDYIKAPIVKWVDKAIPVSAQMLYVVTMEDFQLIFDGNKIYAEAWLTTQTDLKIKNGISFFGKNTKLKSTLQCPSRAKIELYGTIEMSKDATILIHLEEENALLKFTKFCSNNNIKGINFPNFLRQILDPLKTKIRKKTSSILTTEILKALEQNKHNLSFESTIQQTAKSLSQPYLLQDSIWLTPNLKEVFISPFEGKGFGSQNKLHFAIGIHAKPTIILATQKPPVIIPQKVDFSIKKIKNETNIYVQGKVGLDYAAYELQKFLKKYIDNNYAQHGYTIGKVELYPSYEKVVVEIEALKVKNTKKKVMLYLSGIPKYDPTNQEIYLDELKFTTKTQNILLKFAKFLLQPKIMKQLNNNTRFGLTKELKDIQKQLNSFSIEEDLGTLTGKFDYLDINQVFVSASHFELFLQAKGQMYFDLKIE